MAKKTETVNLQLRMPASIHKLLVASAEHNMRSLNQEVMWAVSKYLASDHTMPGDLRRGLPPFDTQQPKAKGKSK